MQRTCAVSKKEFDISDAEQQFYKKIGVPLPTLCPTERQRRRIAYRNFRSLYQRPCDATGRNLISMYHPEQPFPVFENAFWWGDSWDAKSYGRDFDFSKSFFSQFAALTNAVPRMATMNVRAENCTFSNFAWLSRNCYLVFGCVRDEDCLYGHIVWDCKNCLDCLYTYRCQWCSECVDCVDCYDTHFSNECAGCTESYFCHDCRACKNCFGCTNLRQKEFYFFNQKLSRQAYEEKMKAIFPLTRETIADGRTWLKKESQKNAVFPPMFGVKNEDVSGNHVYESKNCHHCFDAKQCEDCTYLFTAHGEKNCHDISFTGANANFCYECLTIGNTDNVRFCHALNQCADLTYCEYCYNCKNCFGCSGMRNAQYCVFNKQYSKKEYETLVEKIISHMRETGEWGEFFPMEHSPFAYNESIVQEYFPLSKEAAISRGWKWRETEKPSINPAEITLPQDGKNLDESICGKLLSCDTCGKNYTVQKAELSWHQKINLPLPQSCPDCRHEARMAVRNPRRLWERTCTLCGEKIKTTFAPDRPERVCCEPCYLKQLS